MSAPTRDLLQDYFHASPGEVVSVNPHWVIAIVRFKYPITFDRRQMKSPQTDPGVSAAAGGQTLVIHSDCTQLGITTSKNSHVSNLTATLTDSGVNYESEIMPGDWMFAWMVQNEETVYGREGLLNRIRQGKPCNKAEDGLKFVGNVYSCFKDLNQDRGSGTKTVRYALQGNGFTQFDTDVVYIPELAGVDEGRSITSWIQFNGYQASQFLVPDVNDEKSQGAIDVNLAIPTLVQLLLGSGIKTSQANPSKRNGQPGFAETQSIYGNVNAAAEGEAPLTAIVPVEVGNLLGKTSRSKKGGALAYADLLEGTYGVQRYLDGSFIIPDGSRSKEAQRKTGSPMMGKFLPNIPKFNGPIWSILGQYLNPAANEIYTCLKENQEGNVVPTLIVRQQPFTSKTFYDNNISEFQKEKLSLTPFLELPRWYLDPSLVWSVHLGRSNAVRFNFIHVTGEALLLRKNTYVTDGWIRNPPVIDQADVNRSGLRAHNSTVNCNVEDQVLGSSKWTKLVADFFMGMHLAYSGTIVCEGIDAPICEGDNLEFDGIVYHIESITHSGSQDARGNKTFITQLQLSHGVRSDNFNPVRPEPVEGRQSLSDDFKIFPGLYKNDNTENDPGVSVEDKQPDPDEAAK